MHRYGTLDVPARAASAPVLKALSREPLTLKSVHVLDCRTEIDAGAGDALIPPALRPGIPSYGALVVSRVEESPLGPFAIAELRMGVRIGAVAGFFLVGAVCDSPAARQALAEGWGYPAVDGEVLLEELYHKVSARVAVAGRVVLELNFNDRRPLPGTRLNVPSIVNLARQGAGGPLRLVNTPIQSTYAQADGGRCSIDIFDGAGFGAGAAFRPTFAMGATIGVADLVLGAVDVTADPVQPAEESLIMA